MGFYRSYRSYQKHNFFCFLFFFFWDKLFCFDEALRIFIFSCCDGMTFYFFFYFIKLCQPKQMFSSFKFICNENERMFHHF